MRRVKARATQLVRVDVLLLATEPIDMRAGAEAAPTRLVSVLGAARPSYTYMFANLRANRTKVLVHAASGSGWLHDA